MRFNGTGSGTKMENGKSIKGAKPLKLLVGLAGFEPATNPL